MVVLDATAGNRVIWPNKFPTSTVFMDIMEELHRPPDIFAAWEYLPFRADIFTCVIFDPPHGFGRKPVPLWWDDPTFGSYYGRRISRTKLTSGIYRATREFLRVAPRLCFKWCDDEISLWKILSLFPKEWIEILRSQRGRPRVHKNWTWWITFTRARTAALERPPS